MTQKNIQKLRCFHKDVFFSDNKKLFFEKGPRGGGGLALNTSFQTKKNIDIILYWGRMALEILRRTHVLRKTWNKFFK